MVDQERKTSTGARICPQCGSAFSCGIAASDGASGEELHCWCFDMPALLPVRADTACLCPACLKKAIRQELAARAAPKDDL